MRGAASAARRGLLFYLVVMAAAIAGTVLGDVLLYPTAARQAGNLVSSVKWTPPMRTDLTAASGFGSPFSESNRTMCVKSDKPLPGYWQTTVKAQKGRIYLAGAWARFANAKLLFWHYGKNAVTGKYVDERLYYFHGFNGMLMPYFSAETLKCLRADPEKWGIFYRTMSFPDGLARDSLTLAYGLYLTAGDVTLSEPFFVDVTDGPRTLDINIDGVRPIVSLIVTQADTRDVCWEKKFSPPVTLFSCTLPDEIDAFRGQDSIWPKGHILTVRYADGTIETTAAPHENIKKRN